MGTKREKKKRRKLARQARKNEPNIKDEESSAVETSVSTEESEEKVLAPDEINDKETENEVEEAEESTTAQEEKLPPVPETPKVSAEVVKTPKTKKEKKVTAKKQEEKKIPKVKPAQFWVAVLIFVCMILGILFLFLLSYIKQV